jgi:hypothetical protein
MGRWAGETVPSSGLFCRWKRPVLLDHLLFFYRRLDLRMRQRWPTLVQIVAAFALLEEATVDLAEVGARQ